MAREELGTEKQEQVKLFVAGYCSMLKKPVNLADRMRVQRALLRETAWQFGERAEDVMEIVAEEFGTHFPH